MTKAEFINELTFRLRDLPSEDISRITEYYSEMIDDIAENSGISEEQAVDDIGSVDEIAAIARNTVWSEQPAKADNAHKTSPWLIVLLVIGSPVWLPLALAAFVVVFSLYITLWALTTPVYALCAGFGSGGLSLFLAGFASVFAGLFFEGFMMLGAGLLLLGLFGLMLIASIYTTKGMIWLSGRLFRGIGSIFTRKGNRK